jgi:hypothetical protein
VSQEKKRMAPTSSFRPDTWQIDFEGSRMGNCVAQEKLKSPLNNGENTSIQTDRTVHLILDPFCAGDYHFMGSETHSIGLF